MSIAKYARKINDQISNGKNITVEEILDDIDFSPVVVFINEDHLCHFYEEMDVDCIEPELLDRQLKTFEAHCDDMGCLVFNMYV